ncbi:uncharacterized protein LOC110880574 [Helianthus annuus]|uniref:uncharacterized protein LOC110880574 n=1 Tax=Helianthus annuus TaxID=4232 RepID=UPI000B8FA073|nr:uncharacterized protein LOC110880574 [Helianthus annuus]
MGGVGTRKNKSTFNVKTVREDLCVTSEDPSSGFVMTWNGWATPKANMLAWKGVEGRLLTKMELEKRGIHISNTLYPGCGYEQESVEHILIMCLMSKTLWWMVGSWLGVKDLHSCSTVAYILSFAWKMDISKKKKKAVNCIVMATLWIIWSSRNEKLFKALQFSNDMILEQLNECTTLWMKVIAKMEYLM